MSNWRASRFAAQQTLFILAAFCCAAATFAPLASAASATKKIVLLAGTVHQGAGGHPPGTHEYELTARLLKHALDSAALDGVRTEVHFDGWPRNPATLDDADTIVVISDGADRNLADHPLLVGDRLPASKNKCSAAAAWWPSTGRCSCPTTAAGRNCSSGSAATSTTSRAPAAQLVLKDPNRRYPAASGLARASDLPRPGAVRLARGVLLPHSFPPGRSAAGADPFHADSRRRGRASRRLGGRAHGRRARLRLHRRALLRELGRAELPPDGASTPSSGPRTSRFPPADSAARRLPRPTRPRPRATSRFRP